MQWSLGQEIEEKFRMIVEKFRQELWEKKKGNLDKTLSNLCQGLDGVPNFLGNYKDIACVSEKRESGLRGKEK